MLTHDADGLIGLPHVQGSCIGVGVDGNGLDTHLLRRADDPTGNLASIRDEDLWDGLYGQGDFLSFSERISASLEGFGAHLSGVGEGIRS